MLNDESKLKQTTVITAIKLTNKVNMIWADDMQFMDYILQNSTIMRFLKT
jgi:hypothetical protein